MPTLTKLKKLTKSQIQALFGLAVLGSTPAIFATFTDSEPKQEPATASFVKDTSDAGNKARTSFMLYSVKGCDAFVVETAPQGQQSYDWMFYRINNKALYQSLFEDITTRARDGQGVVLEYTQTKSGSLGAKAAETCETTPYTLKSFKAF